MAIDNQQVGSEWVALILFIYRTIHFLWTLNVFTIKQQGSWTFFKRLSIFISPLSPALSIQFLCITYNIMRAIVEASKKKWGHFMGQKTSASDDDNTFFSPRLTLFLLFFFFFFFVFFIFASYICIIEYQLLSSNWMKIRVYLLSVSLWIFLNHIKRLQTALLIFISSLWTIFARKEKRRMMMIGR